MNTIQLKTNINCGGCIEKVSHALDEAFGKGHWSVDTKDPRKVLTVSSVRSDKEVIAIVEKAGYKADILN